MVTIRIYIEGGNNSGTASVVTSSSASAFRESFKTLFKQYFDETTFKIEIEEIESVTQAPKYLEHILTSKEKAALLIDLDAPPAAREKRLKDNYNPDGHDKVFFMIQRMETWILSQINCLQTHYCDTEGCMRMKKDSELAADNQIAGKDLTSIAEPEFALKTIIGRYFETRHNKKAKYNKLKNGAVLVGLLDLKQLMQDFDDANNIVLYLAK